MKRHFPIIGDDFIQAGEAASKIKRILKQVGLPSSIIRRVSIAVYEAEMNIVIHAYEGEIILAISADEISVIATDHGPGILDVELAMQEGYSTASEAVRRQGFGAGMGLPNIKRSSDSLHIESVPDKGTTLTMRFDITESEV